MAMVTNGQSNLTSRPHMDGSVVFTRLHLLHASLGSPKSSTQTASRSVQSLLQVSLLWQTDRQTDRQTTLLGV